MPEQRVTLRLTELRCITQSESGGSEPYLWVTYFAFGARPLPFQTGPLAMITPAYDAFRTEFPDNMRPGQSTLIPSFIASASFDMDLSVGDKLVGCVAVLMEEDDTPHSSIVLGRIAYSKEMEKQLNDLAAKRIRSGDLGPITDAEIQAVKAAVESKVEDAIGSDQSIWNLFTNQDDNIGFTYRTFTDSEIQFQYFEFPDIVGAGSANRFVLSGGLSLGPVPSNTVVDLCATPRAAFNAKQDEITSLQTRKTLLQNQLQHATPQQKPGIVAEITATNDLITDAEAALPALQAALDACISRHGRLRDENVGATVVR